MVAENLLKDALSLPSAERQELWERLGESLLHDPSAFPLSPEMKQELERRYDEALKNPDVGYSIEEIEAKINARPKP